MFSTKVNAALSERPNGKRETRTKHFQLLLTATEHKNLTECSEILGVSKGSICRIGINGVVATAKKEAASTTSQGLPISADPFWRAFGQNPQA